MRPDGKLAAFAPLKTSVVTLSTGESVEVYELGGRARRDIAGLVDSEGKVDDVFEWNRRVVAWALNGPAADPDTIAETVDALYTVGEGDIATVVNAALELSGLMPGAVEEAEKN